MIQVTENSFRRGEARLRAPLGYPVGNAKALGNLVLRVASSFPVETLSPLGRLGVELL